jgi:hypothetical protein
MAELTHLDEKLAEVLGLAQAAQAATKKVATLARQEKDTELLELLQRMGDEAAKVEQRCDVATSSRDDVRTAIAKKARETKAEVNGPHRAGINRGDIPMAPLGNRRSPRAALSDFAWTARDRRATDG